MQSGSIGSTEAFGAEVVIMERIMALAGRRSRESVVWSSESVAPDSELQTPDSAGYLYLCTASLAWAAIDNQFPIVRFHPVYHI